MIPLSPEQWLNGLGLFTTITGFIIGLGAVTVIDIHGFLGRRSTYWTEATTRTHKVTKPMIWIGILLVALGQIILFRQNLLDEIFLAQIGLVSALIINGIFLSFKVSPYILEREKAGHSTDLLPNEWQKKIMLSLVVSDIGWWGSLLIFVFYLLQKF